MTNDLYVPLRWALIASLFSPLLMWLWHFAHLPSTLAQAQPVQTVQWQNQTPTQTPLQTPPQTTKPLPIANSTTVNNTGKHSPTTTPTNIPTDNAKGIDVSHYQGKIHWPSVAQTGIHFAYAKATGGDTFVDPMFKTNWYELRKNSLYRGAYHFFFAADDPAAQAKHFLDTVGTLAAHDLPPMLDIEIDDHTEAKELQKRALIWLRAVEKATGIVPIVYTDNGFADSVLTNRDFARYPLWIADYNHSVNNVPTPWAHRLWSLWQHSQTGELTGIEGHVDLNIFNGSLAEMEKFIQDARNH